MTSRVRVPARVRRLMRGLPDEMRGQMTGVLQRGGDEALRQMRARAPKRTGALGQGLAARILPGSLRLRVGFVGRRGRDWPFYGPIQDVGRKAQTVTVHRLTKADRATWAVLRRLGKARGSRKPKHLGTTYRLRIKASPGKRFVTGRYPDLRAAIGGQLRGIWDRALAKMAGASE